MPNLWLFPSPAPPKTLQHMSNAPRCVYSHPNTLLCAILSYLKRQCDVPMSRYVLAAKTQMRLTRFLFHWISSTAGPALLSPHRNRGPLCAEITGSHAFPCSSLQSVQSVAQNSPLVSSN